MYAFKNKFSNIAILLVKFFDKLHLYMQTFRIYFKHREIKFVLVVGKM